MGKVKYILVLYHTLASPNANELLAISIPSAISSPSCLELAKYRVQGITIGSAAVGAKMQAIVAVQLIWRYLGRRCHLLMHTRHVGSGIGKPREKS